MSEWVDVARVEELAPGTHRVVEADDVQIAVFNVDGRYYAIEDLCSHEAYPLAEGELDGETITCPAHGARFCLRTGEALSAPAYAPVPTFPVRVQDGMIQVRDDRWD